MSTDAELLQLYAERESQPAFSTLVERHLALVYSAALRQVGNNPHRAQEVVQTVFTLLARKVRPLSRHPALIGWLYTTTYYTADKLRRAEQRRERLAQHAQDMSDDTPGVVAAVDWDRLRPVLDSSMLKLQERDRTAILLRFFADKSFREIGEQLGLTENAARMRVDRALDAMRDSLTRRGMTSTSTALASALLAQAVTAAPPGLASTISAGAMAATAGGGMIFLMSSTFIKIAVVAGVLAAGSAGLYHQHTLAVENTQLRTELMAVRSQLAQAQRTTKANGADSTPGATSLPRPTPPEPAPAAPAASADGNGPTNADLKNRLTRVADMRNVGRATPVAAIQTILWAIEHGDESLPDMLFLNKTTLKDAQDLMAALPPAVRENYEKPEKIAALFLSKQVLDYVETVKVQSVKQLDPETVEVSIMTGEKGPALVSMQWTPNGWLWKVKPSVIAAAKLDLLGTTRTGATTP